LVAQRNDEHGKRTNEEKSCGKTGAEATRYKSLLAEDLVEPIHISPDGKRLVFASNRNPRQPPAINIFLADWVD
jgi:hypothetical protein